MTYLNVDQIAQRLKISVKATRNKISYTGLKKAKTVNRRALYLESELHLLGKVLHKYYPLKTTVTYYIYQSKMNYEN